MNEILYPIAIGIVISAVVGFFTAGLKKLKSVQVRVDFSDDDPENPTKKLPEDKETKLLP